jgi:dihydroxyacetone kinase-like predicted kinase
MVSDSRNALEESQRLLRERDENVAAFEERVNDSKKSLARTDELLRRLKEIFSRPR